MATNKQEESKVKARKTTLCKKTTEELINIILRKDHTERKNNEKIMALHKALDDAKVIIKANEDIINKKQKIIETDGEIEQELKDKCENILRQKQILYDEYKELEKDISFAKKVIKRFNLYKLIIAISIAVNIILIILR